MTASARTLDDVRSIVPPTLIERAFRPFWVLPLVVSLACIAAGLAVPTIEEALGKQVPFVFEGGPDGARGLLSTIASAMISVTGLVFSITMVVLQLASSQFTPRVLTNFLASRVSQLTLGVFTGTFLYSLTVLRSVRGGSDIAPFVPQVAVTLSFVLVLACVALFLAFIREITMSIQVGYVVSQIGDTAAKAVDDLYPEDPGSGPEMRWEPPSSQARWLHSGDRHGHLTHVDYEDMVRTAKAADAVVEIVVAIGDVVVERQPVARVWGLSEGVSTGDLFDDVEETRSVEKALTDALGIGQARSSRQDLTFRVRQLVDIAERALSPGINDPTTAIQVIDELHRILRPLVGRETPSPCIVDDDEVVRVVHRVPSVESLLALAVEEINHYGGESLQVPRHLHDMLEDLSYAARPELQPAITLWRERIPRV